MMPGIANQVVMHSLSQLPDLTPTRRCVTLALSLPCVSDLSIFECSFPSYLSTPETPCLGAANGSCHVRLRIENQEDPWNPETW